MKKFLSLVLALVMTMSLVTVSAGAADFTDEDSITYEEAVEVMTAIGVVGGYPDGSFGPKGTLTRGAAAKIICNLILGPTTAAALSADTAPYVDVPTDNVFAGYIAYCQQKGIISGYADGTFRPANTLTGYAFMKMLLGVLGYDASIEGYSVPNWSIAVAKRALNIDLDDGLVGEFNGTKAVTREEACLFAFNTLNTCMVKYDQKSTISVGDLVINQNSEVEKIMDGPNDEHLYREEYFKKLTLGNESADAFGRPANTWYYKSKKVGTYAKSPIVTYTDVVKENEMFADVNMEGFSGTTAKYLQVTLATEDGKKAFETTLSAGTYTESAGVFDAATTHETAVIAKGEKSKIAGTGKGTLTEVYEGTNDNEIILVFVNEFLGEVKTITKANTAKDEGRKINVRVPGVVSASYETDEFVKGDYVLVTIANGEIKSAVAPEVLENVAVSSYTSSSVTVDGTTYKYSNRAGEIEDKGAYEMSAGNTYTFYLDSCGNIIKGEVYTATNSDYYMVYDVSDYKTGDFDSDDAYYIYKLVNTEGKLSTVKVIEDDENNSDFNDYDVVTIKADNENDGYMIIEAVAAYSDPDKAGFKAAGHITEFSKTNASVLGNGIGVNNNTIFVIQYETGKFKAVTGLKNMDSYTGISTTPYCVVKNDVALVVFMNTISGSATTSTDDLVYIYDKTPSVSYNATNKKTVYTYKAIVDGKETTIATLLDGEAEGLYVIKKTENGYAKELAAVTTDGVYVKNSDLAATAGKVTFEDGVLKIGATSYVVDDDVVVYTVDGDNVVVTDAAIEDVTGDAVKGTFYLIKVNTTGNNTIETIYFDGTID